MNTRNYRDIVGGALFLFCGLLLAWYTYSYHALGTLQNMGAGFFPTALGLILAGLGFILLVQALFTPGARPEIRIWSPLFVLLGIAAFALSIRPFGLVPAVFAITVISSLAELKLRPISITVLSVTLSVIAWLVFSVALGLPITMLRWPF